MSIRTSSIDGAGDGVWADKAIPKGCVYGPYKGRIDKSPVLGYQGGYSWEVSTIARHVFQEMC